MRSRSGTFASSVAALRRAARAGRRRAARRPGVASIAAMSSSGWPSQRRSSRAPIAVRVSSITASSESRARRPAARRRGEQLQVAARARRPAPCSRAGCSTRRGATWRQRGLLVLREVGAARRPAAAAASGARRRPKPSSEARLKCAAAAAPPPRRCEAAAGRRRERRLDALRRRRRPRAAAARPGAGRPARRPGRRAGTCGSANSPVGHVDVGQRRPAPSPGDERRQVVVAPAVEQVRPRPPCPA